MGKVGISEGLTGPRRRRENFRDGDRVKESDNVFPENLRSESGSPVESLS